MKRVELLLPFALPPPELATDLLRELKAPALAQLLSRGTQKITRPRDDFARALPHEIWLAERCGWMTSAAPDQLLLAPPLLQTCNLPAESGTWFILQPVHLHIARDHLVLNDLRQLALAETDARALFGAIEPIFNQAGMPLHYASAQLWFVHADRWQSLQTATPDSACGHNIDIWLPRGDAERSWRKLQNEVQMEWFEHPVNQARFANRLNPVNSIWLWGGGQVGDQTTHTAADFLHAQTVDGAIKSSPFDLLAHATTTAAEVLQVDVPNQLVLLDSLTASALANDWGSWLIELQRLEHEWFVPLLQSLKEAKLTELRLITTRSGALLEIGINRLALKKFWRKSSLACLRIDR